MAHARKLPSGSWRVRSYVGTDPHGKPIVRSFTAPTKKEAEYLAAEYLTKHRPMKRRELTVGEAIDNYIESKNKILSPATLREYKRTRRTALPELMPIRLDDLTQEEIQRAVNADAASHGWKTVRNNYGLLSATLRIYRPDFVPRISFPQKKKQEMYVPTDEDIKRICEAVKGTPLEIPVCLAAFASLRRSEIAALDNLDIKKRTITVKAAIVRDENGQYVKKTTKTTESERTIEIPDFLVELLAEKKRKGEPFCSITPNSITKRFSDVLKKEGIPHFRFHDLRHYNASVMHSLGVPDKYAMQRGGWKTASTLHKVYQHIMDDKMRETNQLVNDHFQGFFDKT